MQGRGNRHDHDWTDQRFEMAKRMWRDGASARDISNAIGGVSRSAVLGKLYRAGIAGGRPKPRTSKPPRQRRPRVAHCPRIRGAKIVDLPPPVEPRFVCITEIRDGQCKAIVDQTEWGRAKCCGHDTGSLTKPWCPSHDAMFYPLQDRKRAP